MNSWIESLHAIETKAVAIDCIANGEPACDGNDGPGLEGRRGWSLEDTVGFGVASISRTNAAARCRARLGNARRSTR